MDWLKRNAWNLVGITVGVIGIATGYLFYRASIKFPSLSFVDAAPHILVMNYGAVSDSPIRLLRKDGSPVAQSVYTARLYLWNSGTESLRRNSILKPLNIEAESCEILDAKATKISRPDVTKLSAALEYAGAIEVTFDILEPTDWLVLTVLYAAPHPVNFHLDGVVEGVKSFAPVDALQTGDIALRTTWQVIKIAVFLLLGLFAIGIIIKLFEWLGKIPALALIGRIINISFSFGFIALLLLILFLSAYNSVVGTKGFIPSALTK
jgi:hypothetical protein